MHEVQEGVAKAKRARGRPSLDAVEHIDNELLNGALREFLRTGYGGTSMRQIVLALGISKTTLYSRYQSKAELFRAIISQQLQTFSLAAQLQDDDGVLDVGRGLRAYANRTLEISFEGDILEINRLIYSESQRFPELGMAAAERTALGIAQVKDFIIRCAERDRIPARDPDGIAEAFIFMLRGWYVNVMTTNQQVSAATRERWVEKAVHALMSSRTEW